MNSKTKELTKETIGQANKLRNFLSWWIVPFTTPFFTVLNYFSLTNKEERMQPWGIAFFIVSVIYFFFGLGFAICCVAKPKSH